MGLIADFTVEPFVPGSPGPHVSAALAAATNAGASVNVGAFGNEVTADDDEVVLRAVQEAVVAALAAGATRVALEVRRS